MNKYYTKLHKSVGKLDANDIINLCNEYKETSNEKLIEKLFYHDLPYYIDLAGKRKMYVDFETGLSLIYMAVRHAVIKYNGSSNFLSYVRLWISDYYDKHIWREQLVRNPIRDKSGYCYISIEEGDRIKLEANNYEHFEFNFKGLTYEEEYIIKQSYLEGKIPHKIAKKLNIGLVQFFKLRQSALIKMKQTNKLEI